MPRLIATGAQNISALMFFDELTAALLRRKRQQEVLQAEACGHLEDGLAAIGGIELRRIRRERGRRDRHGRKRPLQAVGNDMMLLSAFVSHYGFGSLAQRFAITDRARAD